MKRNPSPKPSKTAYTREDQKEEEKEEGKAEEAKAFSRHASPSIGKYNNQVVVNTLLRFVKKKKSELKERIGKGRIERN